MHKERRISNLTTASLNKREAPQLLPPSTKDTGKRRAKLEKKVVVGPHFSNVLEVMNLNLKVCLGNR